MEFQARMALTHVNKLQTKAVPTHIKTHILVYGIPETYTNGFSNNKSEGGGTPLFKFLCNGFGFSGTDK